MEWKKAGGWIVSRAKEPSTWRGLGLLLAAAGLMPMAQVDLLVSVGVALAGAVDVLRAEK